MKIENCKMQNDRCELHPAPRSGGVRFSIFNFQFSICNASHSPAQNLGKRMTLVAALLLALAPAPARAVDADALRRKQDAQERARDMARQLVTGILDVQLQQLEENGLKELPLYRDIALMRKNIGALVAKEMEQVVELLVKAQRGSEAERDEAYHQARKMIRQIVTRLASERQNLMRRLKSAELTAQVQRLIAAQTKVWQATKSIPDQLPARQESLALAAIEDQGDVKQLFLQLVETLADVSQWGGPLGAGAADGLQILQAASVGKELDSAHNLLGELHYPEAAGSQLLVIKGLRLLLEKLNDTENKLGSDHGSALALTQGLIEKQEKLRDKTKQADLTQPQAERLVEEQAEIRKELNILSQTIGSQPATAGLLEQAKASAYEATGRLFDARNDEAVAEQGKVLANLAELAEQLAHATDAGQSDKSAAELGRQVRDLEQAKADIERIRAEQAQVDRAAEANVTAAAPQEQQVAASLAKVDDNRNLPKAVVSRLAAAEQAAAAAAKELARGPAKADDESQKQTLERADRAIERASAEIAAALDDARRKAAAVEIGELARAAETLERAAAAERDIASRSKQAAGQSGMEADAAKQLAARQAEVENIARSVAQAVEPSSSEAAQAALAAAQSAAAAREQLNQAAAKPGADSKPAANNAAQSSISAAEKLSQAAAKLRRQIDKSAEGLAAESSKQLEKVSPVREAVDKSLAQAEAPVSERMERLAQAQKAVRDAQAAQERAAGRPAAADAMQMANALDDARADQARAEQAAGQLAAGKSSSPLESITREQAVAEQTAKLAEAAGKRPQAQAARNAGKSDPLQETLKEASRAATQAARSALDGKSPAQAQAARDQAKKALDKASQMAAEEAQQAAQKPAAGRPDAAAQKQVSERAAEAGKLVNPDATPAGQSLASAEKTSSEAQRQAQAGSDEKAKAAQEQTAKSLQEAAQQIKSARDKLAQEQDKQLAEQGRQAEQLANRAAAVDPAALGALRDAQARAARANANPAANPGENAPRAAEAQKQARKDVERAAANLNAREQRIEHDKAIAEAVREMTRNQEQAAEDIASRSAELLATTDDDSSTPGKEGDAKPNSARGTDRDQTEKLGQYSKRRMVAERLSQAQREFAQGQRGAGEAAEEVAGQSQIANRPLRDAMQRASKLPFPNLPSSKGPVSSNATRASQAPQEPTGDASSGTGTGKIPSTGKNVAGSRPPNAPKSAGGPDDAGPDSAPANALPDDRNDLGTGFIPNSPETTAELMAGEDAAAQAAALLGSEYGLPADGRALASETTESGEQGNDVGQGKTQQQGQKQGKRQARSSSTGSSPGSSKDGQSSNNLDVKQGALQAGTAAALSGDKSKDGTAARDADGAARALGQESWFAKLPPDLRKAIRAKAQRPPPRSYEEKLQKYFESLD